MPGEARWEEGLWVLPMFGGCSRCVGEAPVEKGLGMLLMLRGGSSRCPGEAPVVQESELLSVPRRGSRCP